MATYTSNYGWTKPSGSDNVDISVLNNNLDDQDSTIHDAFLNMAPPFSESSTYAVDDIVLYTTGLYKCHTAVTTPGSWTGSTNWQVYKLSEGGSGGGGTTNYNDLTNKPSINGVTLSGNKTTNDLGIDKTAIGLGNVPNVTTNNQTPTFTEASARNNIASGEKLSVILGKIAKFFNDLKTVAFSGSFSDLSNKPENANTFQGTIAEWNQLTTAEKKAYDHASIPDSLDGNVTFPASKVMLNSGDSVEEKIGNMRMTKLWENPSPTASFAAQRITLSDSNYDFLLVIANVSSAARKVTAIVKKNTYGIITVATTGNSYRTIDYTSDATKWDIGDGKSVPSYAGATTVDNGALIPAIIYGIKLT